MGTHPIFESDFDCLTDVIESFIAYHAIRPMGDLRQELSNLDEKLAALHERAVQNSPSTAASSTTSSEQLETRDEVMIGTLKSRSDDLSRISVNVLKYYATKEDGVLDEAERRFYERYVKPAKPFL